MTELQGVEKRVDESPLVPLGGKLPYFLEIRTSQLLDILMTLYPSKEKNYRQKINRSLYARSRPGFYMEMNSHLHLAYADQRDGHGSQHWWRLFFDDTYRTQVENASRRNALVVGSKKAAESDNHFRANGHVNAPYEWGGMYFRSKVEIMIAQELDKREVLFFANVRGRVGQVGSPVSVDSGWLNGRLELDFLVFYQRKCAILEVDGSHHQENIQTHRDYIRDRVMLKEGIPTVRFTANECMEKPTDVVTEFLGIF